MKQHELCFTGNSTKEWKEFNKIYHDVFWDKLHGHIRNECKDIMQMQIEEEFDMQIGAKRYERTDKRKSFRCGYRPRTYEILGGHITGLKIPRARNLQIHYSVFGMWERVQDRVLKAMVSAYLMGKSASKTQEIIEAFGQSRFSRTFLCNLVKRFENRLKQYRDHKIQKKWSYVFIDGMRVQVYDTDLVEKVVIFAIGKNDKKETELLGWIIADKEDRTSVRSLLINLKDRGLKRPELFISDGGKGIISALKLEYPHSDRQLCAFHKIKNINNNLKNLNNRKHITREAGDIYQLSKNKKEAVQRLRRFKSNWKRIEPKATRLFLENSEYTLTYFKYPKHMWKTLRTNNPMEQFISKMRDWLSKFNYFHGKINLELAMFTYIYFKTGGLKNNINHKKCTLFLE